MRPPKYRNNLDTSFYLMRNGFSIVELLVVTSIIVLIIAMILPAIQKVREASNKVECVNRLRQLGVAAHHLHVDRGRLPPGYLGPALLNNTNSPALYNEGQWVGHLPLLLPYLEEGSLFSQIKINFDVKTVASTKWFWNAPATGPGPPNVGNYTAAMHQLKIFRCPSSEDYIPRVGNPAPGGGGSVLGLHVFNSTSVGVMTVGWKDEYGTASQFRPLGRTNYLGVSGCGSGTDPFFSKYEGIYTNRVEISLGQITVRDGTSNTLLYGETCGSRWESRVGSSDICWMAGGGLGTYLGLQRGRDSSLISFSSYHPSGVLFCFADCSVRTIRFGETKWRASTKDPFPRDWAALQQLAGWRDGGTLDLSSLVD